jgi:hypothetical protein
MKFYSIITTSAVAAMLLTGCGSDDVEDALTSAAGSASGLTLEQTTISTPTEAKNAMVAASAANGFSSSLDTTGVRSINRSIESRESYTQSCSVDGSITIDVQSAQQENMSSVTVFDHCDNGYGTMNGKFIVSGSTTDGYSSAYKVSMQDYSVKNQYTYIVATLDMDIDANAQTGYSNTIMNGNMHIEEYTENDSIDLGYSNFSIKQASMDSGIEINGQTSISSKNYSCVNGVYNIETLSPLKTYNSDGYSSGSMKINGAVYNYNSDGTVDVTLPNGETTTIEQADTPVCN